MKTVEVSESALESLKAMVEQLQSERDELLNSMDIIKMCCEEEHYVRSDSSRITEIRGISRYAIAKCTQTQSICDWQEKMPR